MKRYSDDEKAALVKDIDDLMAAGKSLRVACKEMHTDSRSYRNFKDKLTNETNNYQSDITSISKEAHNDIKKQSSSNHNDIKSHGGNKRFLVSMPEDKLNLLKTKAKEKGIPYATLARIYVIYGLSKEFL